MKRNGRLNSFGIAPSDTSYSQASKSRHQNI
jgi:hypothetical protein